MKLEFENQIIESSGISGKKYEIGNLAVILNIIRSKMYSDPKGSICREIACNARDAHREIGTPDRPIEITLPSVLEPYFIVKDFGPGMDPDRIKIFTSFGDSTKRSDNLLTGGFGLGGKTPFSYVDNFTIITVVNKIKYVYLTYIDDSQVGEVSLLEKSETNEPNGTSIKIPIQNQDFQAFSDGIAKATLHWKIKPIFIGNSTKILNYYINNSDDNSKVLFENKDWKILNHVYSYYNSNSNQKIIIDGIEYPIVSSSIDGLTNEQKALLENNLRIYCDNGVLTLSSSRENIHYDDKTQNWLKNKFDEILGSITKIYQAEIDKKSSYLEAVNYYFEIFNQLEYKHNSNILVGFIPYYSGNEIVKTILLNSFDLLNFEIKKYSISKDRMSHIKTKLTLNNSNDNLFILHDLPSQYNRNARIKQIMEEKGWQNKAVQVISFEEQEDLKLALENADFQKWMKLLEMIPLSSVQLPKKEKSKTTSQDKKDCQIFKYIAAQNAIDFRHSFYIDDQDLSTEDLEGLYIVCKKTKKENNLDILIPDLGAISYSDLYELYSFLGDKHIYAVKENCFKKFNLTSDFGSDIIEKIQEKFDSALHNPYYYVGDNSDTYIFRNIFSNLYVEEKDLLLEKKIHNTYFKEYLDHSSLYSDKDFSNEKRKIAKLLTIVEKYNWFDISKYKILEGKPSGNLMQIYAEGVKSKYPLLEWLSFKSSYNSYYGSNSGLSDENKIIDLISNYINSIENK